MTGAANDAIRMRPFSQSLPMALLRAREATMTHFRPLLARYDLTEQQWRVLRALAAADEPIDARAVASRTFLLAPSLTRILANLVDRNLIVRAPAPNDLRRSMITLSRQGRRLVAEIAPRSEATYLAIESVFGAERLSTLLEELDALTTLVEGAEIS